MFKRTTNKHKKFAKKKKKWFLVAYSNISDNLKKKNFNRSPNEKVLFIVILRFSSKPKNTLFIKKTKKNKKIMLNLID